MMNLNSPSIITFSIQNELYVIDCEKVLYLQADDHYTHVFYISGTHFMIPFGLSKVTERILAQYPDGCFLHRVGRTFVINTRMIFHINTVKQVVMLSDAHGENHSIHLPKQTLRSLMEAMG